MMGLVIEPMRQGGSKLLHERLGAGEAPVGNRSRNPRFVEPVGVGCDPGILCYAGGAERIECLEQDRIEPVRRVAFAGKSLHPYAIGDKQMVQRAVDGLEESAAVGLVLRFIETGRGVVEPDIRPRM